MRNQNNSLSKSCLMKKSNQPQQQFYIPSRAELENIVVSSVRLVFSEILEDQDLVRNTLTRKETAKILNVTPQTVSKYVKNGLLIPIRKGRIMSFTQSQLINCIKPKKSHRWKI